ncbi:MAG: hypothetical protein ACRDP9_02770 [Kribbellaceae bacterium]
MNKGLLNSLTDAERRLVAETERHVLKSLDEDQLVELHQRIRRTRTKYVKNYRRAASTAVAEFGGRGISHPKQQRDRGKAEIFELALARVSRELAAAANRTAAQLRAERIAAARSTESGPGDNTRSMRRGDQPRLTASKRAQATKTTGGLKKDASSRAAGARRQAKRDAR